MLQVETPSVQSLREVAAICSFFTLIKAFDWLRLFEGTAFYIQLVAETMVDITAFMIVLLFSLIAFGIPLGFLSMNSASDDQVVEGVFNSFFFDVMFNQYLLGLGEFNTDGFGNNPQVTLCYLIFIAATFIT